MRTQLIGVFSDRRMAEVAHFLGRYLDLRDPNAGDNAFIRAITLSEDPRQEDRIARTVLRRFLELDAERTPLVLVLDDLQWADDDTLDAARRTRRGARRLAGACCSPRRGPRCSCAGPAGARARSITRGIDLRNLERDDAEQLFRNLLAQGASRCRATLVEDAFEMTGGNPAFLEQLVRLFLDNGTMQHVARRRQWRLDPTARADTELPIIVEEAIEARIAALETDERDLLEKAAVFGNVFWAGRADRADAARAASRRRATQAARRRGARRASTRDARASSPSATICLLDAATRASPATPRSCSSTTSSAS